jgi:predicted O-methyltransferase YrrM
MANNALFHRIKAYVAHLLTAWNTNGEGIHSPYLFELVRFILRDRHPYYCFADIEGRRRLLLESTGSLDVVDYGSAGTKEGLHMQRRVCDIAKYHLESAKVGQMMFRIVNWMGENEKRPLEILELGTSLGVTTAYLAAADSRNRVVTLEGSGEILKVAKGLWKALKLENIEWKEGNIDDTLFICAREKIDLAFVDANHTYEATMRYVNFLLPRMREKGIIVLDDIHYSGQMERAWQELRNDSRITTSMDLYHVGLLFFDPHYLKRNYIIRL